MLPVALDTSCVISLLSTGEQSPPALLQLVRLALDGQIRLHVTPIVDAEVPDGDDAETMDRRGYIRQSMDQFPVAEISSRRLQERDKLAKELLHRLWPNVQEGSRKHGNSLNDCKHLASHVLCGGKVFVTLDQELARKASQHSAGMSISVLSPDEAVALVWQPSPPEAVGAWNPIVRRASHDDRQEITQLLAPIRENYTDFDAWLNKALSEKETWVAELSGRIGAVAVWGRKTDTTVKLATFRVGDDHQGRGLGPHLLFHQVRHWIELEISKVFVTVSGDLLDVATFFLSYGFRIEGSSARRYNSDAVEFILAKHLVYEVVDDQGLDPFLERVGRQLFDLPDDERVRDPSSWFLPPSFGTMRAERAGEPGRVTHVEIVRPGEPARELSVSQLEELIYPARFDITGRKAYMVPIMPRWADRMMHVRRPQVRLFRSDDKLALRTDNAYYSHPFYAEQDLCDAPALFYISSPDCIVAGFSRIVERTIAEPEDLFLRYDRMGVYGLDDIRRHVKTGGQSDGCAMAIQFAWWVPFSRPVSLDRLRAMGLHHPQHIEAIEYRDYERLLHEGGVTW